MKLMLFLISLFIQLKAFNNPFSLQFLDLLNFWSQFSAIVFYTFHLLGFAYNFCLSKKRRKRGKDAIFFCHHSLYVMQSWMMGLPLITTHLSIFLRSTNTYKLHMCCWHVYICPKKFNYHKKEKINQRQRCHFVSLHKLYLMQSWMMGFPLLITNLSTFLRSMDMDRPHTCLWLVCVYYFGHGRTQLQHRDHKIERKN